MVAGVERFFSWSMQSIVCKMQERDAEVEQKVVLMIIVASSFLSGDAHCRPVTVLVLASKPDA